MAWTIPLKDIDIIPGYVIIPYMPELIKKMREYMAHHNLKNYELARALNTTESNISNWMNGKHKISKSWTKLIKQELKLK